MVAYAWEERFRTQYDIFKFGHIYAYIQQQRIIDAKKSGILPPNAPETEKDLQRMRAEQAQALAAHNN